MAGLDYKRLYKLQDRIFACLFSVEREFYLTGGTCLSRFYQEKRYSDDLDFFAQNSPRFSFAVKNIKKALEEEFSLVTEVEAKQFVRLRADNLLQICYFYSFSWKEILDSAHEKAGFSSEDLVIRLKSFPRELFSSINCIDDNFLSNFDIEFPMLIEEIIRIADHKAIGEE